MERNKNPGVSESEITRKGILFKFRLLDTPLRGHTETCDPVD